MKARALAYLRDCRGTTAVEFAIVGPVLVMLIIGVFYVGLLLFSLGSMHFAVEDAARCASVKTAVCTSHTTTEAYALDQFFASSVLTPTFVSTNASCGHRVTATASFDLNIGTDGFTVPLTAAACFP